MINLQKLTALATIIFIPFIFGCSSSTPHRSVHLHSVSISPPPGLTVTDVEVGVIMGMSDSEKVPQYTPGQQIADKALKVAFWPFYRSSKSTGEWFYDGREANVAYARFEFKKFTMRVAAHYSKDQVTLDIIESENLNQTPEFIHRNSYVWLNDLSTRIRRGLSAVAQNQAAQDLKQLNELK